MRFKSDEQRKAVFAKKKFYHGSAGFRGRVIMADGLVPPSQIDMPHSRDEKKGPEFDDYVFLTTNKDLAKIHAERRARHWEDTEYGPIVYEVELEEEEVVPDTFDPVRYPDSFKYEGIIPKERIKKVKFSANDNRFAETIYHVGKKGIPPNVEDLSRRDFGRDTGYMGTGIYGYKTKDPINYKEDIEVEELTLEKPLIVGRWFHDHVRDVSRGAFYPDKKYDGYGFEDRARLLTSILRDSGIDISVDEIKEEFLKDASDIDSRKNIRGKEQAITRILKKRGYDGIIPDSEVADHCGYGCIKYLSDEELQSRLNQKKDPNIEEDKAVCIPIEVD